MCDAHGFEGGFEDTGARTDSHLRPGAVQIVPDVILQLVRGVRTGCLDTTS